MKHIFFFLCLAGCGAQPSPLFFGAERVDVTHDGRAYTVFHKENRVEVIRLGYARPGEHAAIRQTMIALIPEVTGCQVDPAFITGDSGELKALLICPAG